MLKENSRQQPALARRSKDGAAHLVATRRPNLVQLGRELREAQDRGEFNAACVALSIHTRKAYDLITIADAVDGGRLDAKMCEELGWSKARLIATRATKKRETRQAIAFARANTLPALLRYFQQGSNGQALVTKSFHLTKAEAEELEDALQEAGARKSGGRLVNRSEALMTLVRMRRPANAPRSRRMLRARTSE